MKDSSHPIKEIIKLHLESNFELKKLYNLHQGLDEAIQVLSDRNFLTREEESRLKSMKVQKLTIMESMIALLPSSD